MCGWIASLTGDVTPGLELMLHRGIRSQGIEHGAGSMGHVRLPIVGLGEEWDQPVKDGNECLVYCGEVLDFRERDPSAQCDLPLVVKTWKEKGPDGFKSFDGFWSVAVMDRHHESLHIFCDYLAQKPTYWWPDKGAAASELDALSALGQVTPDEIYFSSVIKWGYCPETDRTPYREIKKLLPGEHVVMTATGYRRRISDPLTPRRCDLKKEIEQAVQRRVLSADVPVACLVSGGLDSSIVYTLAKRYGTVIPYFADSGDTVEQLRVSAVVGEDKAKTIFWDLVSTERAMRYMQEPIDLGSLVPQTALSDQVKERVCLTGDGADEVFGGYGRASRYDSQMSDIYHELVAWHLPRLDRIMMRNQIEIRTPFLARKVVEGAMALQPIFRRDKTHLRELFRSELPPGIADAPKKPLRTPRVEDDRELVSRDMVAAFRRSHWPSTLSERIVRLREMAK